VCGPSYVEADLQVRLRAVALTQASDISLREAARHAGKRSDGIADRVDARVAPGGIRSALNLADPPSRLAFSRLRCRHGSKASLRETPAAEKAVALSAPRRQPC